MTSAGRTPVFPAGANQRSARFKPRPLRACAWRSWDRTPTTAQGRLTAASFSVQRGGPRPPPSLKNIFRELEADLGVPVPAHGDLSAWAERGVLLLNTVLTVREGQAGSHHKRGWERLTDAAIRALNGRAQPLVFVLWGKPAEQKRKLIDGGKSTAW